ncbi:MAG: hypothetical protein Q9227_005564 [Pyrenula ochraceoflavens]
MSEIAEKANGEREETSTSLTNGTGQSTSPGTEPLDFPLSSVDGLVKKPFAKPLDSVKAPPPRQLNSEQQAKYKSLLEKVLKWTEIPNTLAKNPPKAALTESERMFLTRECLMRYLRATKWNVTEAETRLMSTLSWRREYAVESKLTPEHISVENETGKQLITGFDVDARPCLYMFPNRQNTEKTPRQVEHLVFMLERLLDLMVPGQETLTLLINFSETKSGQGATLAQGRQVLWILQNHYPERLGRACITNLPFYIWGFFKLITPFIDPLTKEKLKFNEEMSLTVPKEQLLEKCGGHVQFEYDHSVYWPALIQLADDRRQKMRERWEKGGKRIGEHEDYMRGAAMPSLVESELLDKPDTDLKSDLSTNGEPEAATGEETGA